MALSIIKAGIGWGPAHAEADARYIVFNGERVGEIYITEKGDLEFKLYPIGDPTITLEGQDVLVTLVVL